MNGVIHKKVGPFKCRMAIAECRVNKTPTNKLTGYGVIKNKNTSREQSA
jgi:hypothetical protein